MSFDGGEFDDARLRLLFARRKGPHHVTNNRCGSARETLLFSRSINLELPRYAATVYCCGSILSNYVQGIYEALFTNSDLAARSVLADEHGMSTSPLSKQARSSPSEHLA